MKNSTILAAALCALAAPFAARAGIKYWDNPDYKDFDVGDYVQDGLVVNYDGIRNAGPDAAHDSDALVWVNCANPGVYDQTRYSTNGTAAAGSSSATAAAWNNDASQGSWTDKGFVFDKDAAFYQSASFAIPKTYTIQSLVEATPGNQSGIGYIMCPYNASNWAACSLGIRSSQFNYGGGNVTHTMYLVSGSINKRPAIRGASGAPFTYVTAINNVNDGVAFAGTKAPWDAAYTDTSYGHAYDASRAGAAYTYDNGFCLGSHYPRTDEMFKGTIKNFRFYNRCLSDAEVLWNRVVDDARYFGFVRDISEIPATNVVEAVTISGVRDYHYAVDDDGCTFTAPAVRTVDGTRYVCGGYTLETSTDGGATWGSAVSSTELSYTASSDALVRLTWQYAAESGEGRIVTYDVGDYVQDGLVWNYDGICNAGTNVAHDASATNWVNLGTGGSTCDLYLQRRNVAAGAFEDATALDVSDGRNAGPGVWTADGFAFEGEGRFRCEAAVDVGTDYTFQVLVDADTDEMIFDPSYLFSASWNNCSLAFRKAGAAPKAYSWYWNQQGATYRPYIYTDSHEYGYATAIMNADTTNVAFFAGTTAPTSGGVADGFHHYDSLAAFSGTGFNIGGYGSADGQFSGVLKFFRFYNRSLTDEEVAHNRRVDNWRYFGIYEPETTNVVVQSTYSYLQGNEADGPYAIEGSYTFTAPESVTAANGIAYACDGYTVETWDDSTGTWGGTVACESCSYTYSTSSGLQRLTWRWKATSGLRSAADYTIDDLAAGAVLHYDGLLNAGESAARSTTATKWVNLGSAGSAMDLTRSTSGSDSSLYGAWGDKGYRFEGYSQFNSAAAAWHDTFTAQCLAEADVAENKAGGKDMNLFATSWDRMGVRLCTDGNTRLDVQALAWADRPCFTPAGDSVTFLTAMEDATAQTACIFEGVEAPASGGAADGFASLSSIAASYSNSFRLGGWGGGPGGAQNVIGTIYAFRYYDRILTEEELVRNRNVDAVRYFGALAVTNVVVAVEEGSGIVPDETAGEAYFVEGAYTFTATGPAGLGYRLSVPDGNGGWQTLQTFTEGASCAYDKSVASTPDCVKIEWRVQKPFVMVMR